MHDEREKSVTNVSCEHSQRASTTTRALNAEMRAMEIYLMRHGEAVHAARWRGPDHDRPLTPDGVKKLKEAVKEMKRSGFLPPVIVSSPYLRAKETAALVAEGLGLPAPILSDNLSSGVHPEKIRGVIVEYKSKAPLLLVGHMPELAIMGSRITTEPVVMDKGLEPADVLALEAGALDTNWGDGKILWWRKLEDWKSIHS